MDPAISDSISLIDAAMRLSIAALLGALVGIEREWRDQSAGLRTHMLVALGAAGFTLASLYAVPWVVDGGSDSLRDPLRMTASIVSGIGFSERASSFARACRCVD